MINDAERQRIQAEAFQKMEAVYHQSADWTGVGAALGNIIEDATKQINAAQDKWTAIKHELDRTRWKRLQQTQFVYWSHRDHPRILQAGGTWDGTYSYLQEHVVARTVESDTIQEQMMHIEAELFMAYGDDEVKVFWRGWEATPVAGTNQVVVSCVYCMCYVWKNGTIAHEPSNYQTPRVYNLNNDNDRKAAGLPPIPNTEFKVPDSMSATGSVESAVRFPIRRTKLPTYLAFNKPRCS